MALLNPKLYCYNPCLDSPVCRRSIHVPSVDLFPYDISQYYVLAAEMLLSSVIRAQ